MKRRLFVDYRDSVCLLKKQIFVCIGILLFASLSAQEQNSLDWDIDTIFDEPAPTTTEPSAQPPTSSKTPEQTTQVTKKIQRRGYTFGLDYRFITGVAPGWYEMPGTEYYHKEDYYLDRFITMISTFSLDAQITENFRAMNNINFEIPGAYFYMGDFFFDYKLYDAVFLRGGKYNMSWGISPNFGFTNLLIRVPKDAPNGDSYIFKADVPIGNGGFQVLTMTRFNLTSSAVLPKLNDFGYGAKYNFAHRLADLDVGFFAQEGMPFRGFLSIKTTIKKLELYNELLVAIKDKTNETNVSFNIGFARSFFDKKLEINGEFLYNGEKDTYWYQHETDTHNATKYSFIDGANIALNIVYKPWSKGNPRLFLQTRYAPMENSAQIIPGFLLTPWDNVDFYFSVPMGIGNRDGYYYNNTIDVSNKDKPLPFAVIFSVRIGGGVSFGHYY
ncbi:hypothetical protein R84B8_00132 [Treponema sp. R8-4-B8]